MIFSGGFFSVEMFHSVGQLGQETVEVDLTDQNRSKVINRSELTNTTNTHLEFVEDDHC